MLFWRQTEVSWMRELSISDAVHVGDSPRTVYALSLGSATLWCMSAYVNENRCWFLLCDEIAVVGFNENVIVKFTL